MRTDFFSSFSRLSKEFREHWDALWTLSSDTQRKLLPYILDRLRADTKGQAKEVVEQAVSEVGGDEALTLKVLDALTFVASEWNPLNDTPQSMLQDMRQLSLLPPERTTEAEQFMLAFFSALEQDSIRRVKQMFASSVAPNYRGSTAVVDLRPVIDRPFGTGLDDKVDDYRPKCVGWIPVALVKFLSTDSDRSSWMIQCTEQDLTRIIDTVEAARRDIQAAKESFGVDRLES